jgi:hypothetical protein
MSYCEFYFVFNVFFIAVKVSALITCSIRQASSAATVGSTPMEVSQSVRNV